MPQQEFRAIIHVDMDAFYASVEQHDDSGYRNRPVIVGGLGRRGVVAASSYEAREFGVYSAMPMTRARKLCPGGVFLQPRMHRYREVSKRIFAVFHQFTPLVEGLSVDEAFLDVTGSLRLMGSMEDIGRAIRAEILRETGLQASIGMASNKFLAKLASDMQKPHGFVRILHQDVQRVLDPMPVKRLWGVGPKTAARLRRQGILTIGQLRKSDESVLRAALGNRTGHFLALAQGQDDRPVVPEHEDKSISHEMTFDQDLRDQDELRSELQRLSQAVMRRLRKQQLAARTVHVKIRDHRFQTVTRSRSLRVPTTSTGTAYAIAAGLLGKWLESHANTPVRLLGMGVSGLEDSAGQKLGIDQALDAIADRYGEEKITRGLAMRRVTRRD